MDNVQQIENKFISSNRTVIVPRLNFTCNGRITNIRVGINSITNGANFPYIQVWRRQSPTMQLYNLVNKVQIQSNHINAQLTYLEAVISLTGDNRIQFLSRDVIGFYSPPDSGYVIRDIATTGYMYYEFVGSDASSFDLDSNTMTSNSRQTLIQFAVGEYGKIVIILRRHLNVIYTFVNIHLCVCTAPQIIKYFTYCY